MGNKKGIEIEKILELYNKRLQPIEIAEQLNCSSSNITRRLKKIGIEIKRNYSKHRYSRLGRHSINEDFFNVINNEAKAYFLGLMYSDGSVTNNQFYLKLKDEDIIIKFKKCLESSAPIQRRYNGNYDSYCLTISSKKSCSNLIKWGCVPNKTKIIQLPKLREDLYRHFIRGFFDGDGCLQLHDKIYRCRFDLTSASKQFLEQLRPIITNIARTNGSLNKETKYSVWHLNYSGHQVADILDWLYKDSNFYLKRKYDKYQILKTNYNIKFA